MTIRSSHRQYVKWLRERTAEDRGIAQGKAPDSSICEAWRACLCMLWRLMSGRLKGLEAFANSDIRLEHDVFLGQPAEWEGELVGGWM